MDMTITGAKGGGGSSDKGGNRGTEISSVAYMKLLLALTEGEAAGGFTGKEIYLDGTPLLDDNGAENFPGVTWEWRSGTADQAYIQGFPSVENELNVGTELKYGTPWVKSINNTQLSAVRLRLKFPNGLYALRDSGGKSGYQVEYAVDISTDGSTYVEYGRDEADGIANTGYERSYRINLPPATSGWQIRVRRLTENTTDGRHADTTRIESMTEIVDAKLRYPHTALLFIQFDAKLFDGRTPAVTVKMKGIICRVPANYDPNTRTYTGNWDGTFKWAWTNNPAWIFYDIVTRTRYGLGQRITQNQVDKWTLYQIGQYCDTQVSDGAGGKEARHLCDLYISQRTDAWTVLMDLASIFRGMISWSNNLLSVDADMPRELDPDFVFNKSNIVGAFNFSSTSEKTNYSAAIVTYSNPANRYADDQASAHVQRISARFGFNTLEKTAVGCTRASEAQRAGLWAIETNDDDNAVEFKTGMEGRIPRVGKIIGINNAPLAGRNNGGRVAAASGTKITLDRIVAAKAGDALIINLPTGRAESRKVVSATGRAVTVDRAYSTTPNAESGWVLDQADLAIELFRVKRIVVNSDDTVTINGLPFNPTKFARIDDGAIVEERPVTVVPPRGQETPANVTISSAYRVEQGIGITTLIATWDSTASAIAYEAQWRQNNGDWINVPRTGNTRFEVDGIYTGRYVVRVRAINALDIASVWSTSSEVQLTGKVGQPPAPLNFRTTPLVWGCQIDWDFPAGTTDTLQTEIHYATDAAGSSPLLLSDIPYPQHSYQQMGLRAGTEFWYRARLIDRIGNKGPWTAFIMGGSSSIAGEYLPDIDNQIKQTPAYKELTDDILDLSGDLDDVNSNISTLTANTKATTDSLLSDIQKEVTDRNSAVQKEINDRTIADQNEASARANALLQEKNERVAAVSNVATQLQTATDSMAQQIAQVAAGSGEQFDSLNIWHFDTTVEGWAGNGTPTITTGWLRPANHASDPFVASPASLAIAAASYRFIKLRIKKVGSPAWTGELRWRNAGGFNDTDRMVMAEPYYNADGIATLDFDDIPWLAATTINQIRLDLSSKQDAANYFLIDWVAVGRPTPGAGMAALQAESLARVNADSAEATQRETLATQLRGGYDGADASKVTSGLIYSERQTRVTAEQAISSSVNALETNFNSNKATVQQNLNTLTDAQTSQGSAITKLTNDLVTTNNNVGKKADATALSALDNRVTTAEGKITSQGSSITSLENNVSNLQVGGSNLLRNTDTFTGYANVHPTETYLGDKVLYAKRLAGASSYVQLPEQTVDVTGRTDFVYSFYAKGAFDGQKMTAYFYTPSNVISVENNQGVKGTGADGSSTLTLTSSWARYWVKWKATAITGTRKVILARLATADATRDQEIYLCRPQLELGNLMSDWSPNSDDVEDSINANATALASLTTRVTTSEGTLTSQGTAITKLTNDLSTTNTNVGKKADSIALTALDSRVTSAEGQITAQASQLTSLKGEVDDSSASIEDSLISNVTNALANNTAFRIQRAETATAASSITRIDQTIASDKEVLAQTITSINAEIGSAKAAVTSEQTARATADEALGKRIDTVTAATEGNAAQIISEQIARADGDGANAQAINQVKATADGAAAAVQTNATAIAGVNGRLNATYSLKVQVEANGVKRIAGMVLGADVNGSNFLVSADTFAVYNPTTTGQELVFAATGGQMFLRSAFIQDGSIDNAKIGNYIQSNGYVAGSVGWRLGKDGSFENNGAVPGQGSMRQTNQKISVRDANGVLRVQIGYLDGVF